MQKQRKIDGGNPRRPVPITVLCVILGIFATINLIYSLLAGETWYLIGDITLILCLTSVWQMKKYGVYLYFSLYFLASVAYFFIYPKPTQLVANPLLLLAPPIIFGAVVLPYWGRFRPDTR